jgi:hypothetical protein
MAFDNNGHFYFASSRPTLPGPIGTSFENANSSSIATSSRSEMEKSPPLLRAWLNRAANNGHPVVRHLFSSHRTIFSTSQAVPHPLRCDEHPFKIDLFE